MRFRMLALLVGCVTAAPEYYRQPVGFEEHIRRASSTSYDGGHGDRYIRGGRGGEIREYKEGQHDIHNARHAGKVGGFGSNGGVAESVIEGRNIEIIYPSDKDSSSKVERTQRRRSIVKVNCGPHKVADYRGTCVKATVSNSVFVFDAPEHRYRPPVVPKPKVYYNVVFVYTPQAEQDQNSIIIPPPQTKTIVYVLTKSFPTTQRVIQVPELPKQKPEVFYVNYNEGDNPLLAGMPLQKVLGSRAAQKGVVIGGGGGRRGGLGEIVYVDAGTGSGRESAYVTAETNMQEAVFVDTKGRLKEAALFLNAGKDERREPLFVNAKMKGVKN